MLIHVTRFTAVQGLLYELVKTKLQDLMARIMSGGILKISGRYGKEFYTNNPVDGQLRTPFVDAISHTWMKSRTRLGNYQIYKVKRSTERQRIALLKRCRNGYANKSEQDESALGKTGLNVIAIGGDKLSRGLTLEGLTISYYLRASECMTP